MHSNTLTTAVHVVGLAAASRKLREAVGAAVALPEEAQDQVADAMQGVLQQLLLASRLKSLPGDVLSAIARRAGRPTRRASRALSNAYGPLDCGLRLDGLGSAEQLLSMVALSPRRFDHVTALVLSNPGVEGQEAMYPEGFMPALCNIFPKLSSLSAARHADLAGLAPLAPHLTALTLPARSVVVGRLSGLHAFTGLRSFALPLHFWVWPPAQFPRFLQELSSLRHLQLLDWLGEGSVSVSAAACFAPLHVLAHLTSLRIRPAMDTWDQAAVDTLRTGFPNLSALALALQSQEDDDGMGNAVANHPPPIAALAARTALTALELEVGGLTDVTDLSGLSTLRQLGKLSVTAVGNCTLEQVLEATSGATALTSLHLGGLFQRDTASNPFCFTGFKALKDLRIANMYFSQGSFPSCLSSLTAVTKLGLVDVVWPRASHGPEEPLGLGQLSSLEVLEAGASEYSGGGGGRCLQLLLGELGGLSRLRELTLAAWEPQSNQPDAEEVLDLTDVDLTDVDLWQLLPLCHTLTRLVLRGIMGLDALQNVQGTGLAVVGRLTCLRELVLCNMAVLRSPRLHEYLLPLPASLRRLELESDGVAPGVQASLQAAARGQDCAVRVGWWM